MIQHPAPVAAEHPEPVGVVHHQRRVEPVGQVGDFRQRRDLAGDRVHAVHRDHFRLGRVEFLQPLLERGRVLVIEPDDGGPAQHRAVPQRRVHARIEQQRIAALGDGAQAGGAGEVPGAEHVAGFLAEKRRQVLFQLDVIGAAAVGQARAAGARAPFPQGRRGGLDHPRMPAQPEILVAGHHHHRPAVHGHGQAVGRLDCVVPRPVSCSQFGAGIRHAAPQNGFDLSRHDRDGRVG